MKPIAFLALIGLAAWAPIHAHPGHEHPAQPAGYATWVGALPKGQTLATAQSRPDYWSKVFVSKYRISGSQPILPSR